MNKFVIGLCCLCLSISAQATSPVWKISKNGHHFYLGGTIHLLANSDYPLPEAFDKAYAEASTLVFETDIEKMKAASNQTQLLRKLLYPSGENLRQKLSPETYQRLDNFFAARGVPTSEITRFRIGMTVMTLTLIELRRNGLAEEGVDMFFMKKAKKDQKTLDSLEELNAHMDFIANMGTGQEDEMIRQTLDDLEQIPTMIRNMKAAWRAGNNKQLADIAIREWKAEFPNVFKRLLTDRNNDWMRELAQYNNDADVEFVLVGALHLVGKEGLLAQLKNSGHTLKQLP
ncbi:TraB/GumN family protein [Pseudoteredinibacter isoporae]|uniref:TraB/GumN family protein n=1 Tax=Pseudoteredinibacter isoporae TaxID=570281 RepID=UPI0031021323